MAKSPSRFLHGSLAAVTLVVASNASANIGVPMVAVFLPPMWLSLVPVVLLEAWILRRTLSVPNRSALAASAVGNVTTTIIGIPLVWAALAVAEMLCCGAAKGLDTTWHRLYAVTVQAPWLIPYESDLGWMVPAALAVLAIPFFVLTVAIEGYVNRRFLREVGHQRVWRATWVANAWSYLMLLALAWPAFALANRFGRVFSPLMEWFIGIVFGFARLLAEH